MRLLLFNINSRVDFRMGVEVRDFEVGGCVNCDDLGMFEGFERLCLW